MSTPPVSIDSAAEAAGGVRPLTIRASIEQVILATGLYWTLAANRPFLAAALDGRPPLEPATWGYGLALAAGVTSLHVFLLALVANRWTFKPMLAVLVLATAFASYFMQHYGIYLDPSMLRNVLRTDGAESRELLSWSLAPWLLLYAGLPLAMLWRVRLVNRRLPHALLARLALLLLSGAATVASVLAVFQPLSSLMRNHKEVRYLVTPANYVWSLASAAARDAHGARLPRKQIGLDARPGATWAMHGRPAVVVLIVGETARAANWGLGGYARATTPQLSRWPVINFRDVSACGTSTEVSLPCMFAPVGRRDYDEDRIRHSENLLHVLARAGVDVTWRDNQSGCKGVCAGLPNETVSAANAPGLCGGDHCLDEGLLAGLDARLAHAHGAQLLVLHPMGNHGPAYFRRYPPAFARFQPACENDDLQRCTREQIVNAYDNALLYTDHVLASAIATLQSQSDRVDTALIYVSDHGESLGERNVFLHGVPFAIAPSAQTRVPMIMWMSRGFGQRLAVNDACLRRRAEQPAAHDHLFHTLLGMLDVRTSLYDPQWDLLHGCRPQDVPMASK